jgi:hypothetical protein
VYGVDEGTENHDIQSEFGKFGTVTDVYNTGKGYAFVTFDRDEDSKTAIQEMDGQTMFGKQIKVRDFQFFLFFFFLYGDGSTNFFCIRIRGWHFMCFGQRCGSGMFFPDPRSELFHPRSRIQSY